jgi:hypothetical protein
MYICVCVDGAVPVINRWVLLNCLVVSYPSCCCAYEDSDIYTHRSSASSTSSNTSSSRCSNDDACTLDGACKCMHLHLHGYRGPVRQALASTAAPRCHHCTMHAHADDAHTPTSTSISSTPTTMPTIPTTPVTAVVCGSELAYREQSRRRELKALGELTYIDR